MGRGWGQGPWGLAPRLARTPTPHDNISPAAWRDGRRGLAPAERPHRRAALLRHLQRADAVSPDRVDGEHVVEAVVLVEHRRWRGGQRHVADQAPVVGVSQGGLAPDPVWISPAIA